MYRSMCLRLGAKEPTHTMTKQEFIDWATRRRWHMDRHGHLRKSENGREYRFKLSSVAARYEIKTDGAGWARIRSNYFKDLQITPEGKLAGLLRGGCGSEPQAAPQTINPQTQKGAETMRTFTITPDNTISVFASQKEAKAANLEGAELFASREELATVSATWPISRLVETWNAFAGVVPFDDLKPVKKFENRHVGVARIWGAVQKLNAPEAAEATTKTDSGEAVKPAPSNAKATKKAKADKTKAKDTREGSRKATIVELIGRTEGATVQEIVEATGWLSHSVRGFISNLVRKAGYKIESRKRESGEHAYRPAAGQ